MNKMKSAVMTLAVLGALAAIPAKADTYTFTNDHCSSGGCLPFTNLITVTQVGPTSDNTVNVTVTGNFQFVSTGAGGGPSFFFNLLGNPTISVGSVTPGWALVSGTAGTLAGDGFSGEMEYAMTCLNISQGCTNGGGGGKAPPLSFNVIAAGLAPGTFTPASFHDQGGTPNNDLAYFVADVIANGNTGLVGATGSVSSVPEPISLSLVGGGLLALGLFRKRFGA
jgi:hypothetical protein